MSALNWTNNIWDQLANEHRRWLSAFEVQYLRNWEKLPKTDDEAAKAEARMRSILQDHRIVVEPNEDLTGNRQQPDFKCSSASGSFYVEVTCISKNTATKTTGLPEEPHGLTACKPLNDAIFEKCREKAKQCANLDGPALLAIGTFHVFAAMHSFKRAAINRLLTGEANMAWNFDAETGKQVGNDYQVTEFYSAAFLRPDKTEEVGFARSSLSALLLCGFGSDTPRMTGVLHPNPARSFDPSVLSDVEFGQVEIDRGSRRLNVCWPKE